MPADPTLTWTPGAPACRLCRERGKPWSGDAPRCGFDATGAFVADNWNCATLNALRTAVVTRQPDHFHFRDDMSAGSIGVARVPDVTDGVGQWLVLTWYKDRGCTGRAYLVGDDCDALPLTLELAEVCLRALAESEAPAEAPAADDLGIKWTPGAPTGPGRWLCDVTDDRETGDRVAMLLTWRSTPRGLRASLVWNDGEHILTPSCVVRHAPIPDVAEARREAARECAALANGVAQEALGDCEMGRYGGAYATAAAIVARFGLDGSEPQPDPDIATVSTPLGSVAVRWADGRLQAARADGRYVDLPAAEPPRSCDTVAGTCSCGAPSAHESGLCVTCAAPGGAVAILERLEADERRRADAADGERAAKHRTRAGALRDALLLMRGRPGCDEGAEVARLRAEVAGLRRVAEAAREMRGPKSMRLRMALAALDGAPSGGGDGPRPANPNPEPTR